MGWDRYTGKDGAVIGMHSFGSSAPIKDLMKAFGFAPDKVLAAARDQIAKHGSNAKPNSEESAS
jgi:transketolase